MSLKEALKRSSQAGLLHVASPRACNMQQMDDSAQQHDATPAQHHKPKASNDEGSECNTNAQQPCNKHPKSVQQMASEKGAVVAPPLHGQEREIWKVYDHGLLVGWLVGMTFPEAVGRAQARWGRVNLVKAEKAEEEGNV